MAVSVTPTSGIIPSTPAAWATSNILAVATGRVIRMHLVHSAASTRRPLALLEGHTASVTIVVSLPGMRIASGGEDGTVRIWDVATGQSLRVFDLAHPVLDMTCVSSEELLCLTSTNLFQVRLKKERSKRRRPLVKKVLSDVMSKPTRVVSSSDGSVVVVSDAMNVHITGVGSGGVTTTMRCRYIVTALAIARDGNTLAVADEIGVISLYRKPRSHLGEKRRYIQWDEAAPALLHWHASAPQALAFAHEDSVLLSAGREAVLVTWRLSPTLFGTKTFLPRLRSPISAVSVSPDAKMYAISQTDNSVRVIDQLSAGLASAIRGVPARLLTFSELNPEAVLSSRVSPDYIKTCAVSQDSSHREKIWIAGAGPSLQLFNAFSGSIDDELQVIPRNFIFQGSRMDGKASGSSSAAVYGLAVHGSGLYLATIDCQDMSSSQTKQYGTDTAIHTLKFWRREAIDQPFDLDGVVSQPHGFDYSVSSMCFHPTLPLLVTASRASKTFKIWGANLDYKGSHSGWRNEIDMDYKNMSCNRVCFSSDGSLLVVACDHVLTMWQIEDCHGTDFEEGSKSNRFFSHGISPETSPRSLRVEFLHALIHPPLEEHIVSISFIFKSVPLLIAITRNGIYVWHALSQSIWWSTRIRSDAQKLAVDPDSGRFALQIVIPSVGAKRRVSAKEVSGGSHVEHITDAKSLAQIEANGPHRVSGENSNIRSVPELLSRTKLANESTETDACAHAGSGKHELLTCTDRAIVIYDASSPIPLHIHRLATGAEVVALSFVKQPGQLDRSTSALLCIDSRMEVLLYDTERDTPPPGLRVLASDQGIRVAKPAGNLEKVLALGNGNSNSGKIPVDKSFDPLSTSKGVRIVEKAFSKYFHGPTHIQAPVGVNSFEFVKALLLNDQENHEQLREVSGGRNLSWNNESSKTGDSSTRHDPGSEKSVTNPPLSMTKVTSEDRDGKEIRAFCVSAVRKATEKSIPAR